tara:strand:- start:209 stop:874 length:666 start_codon:yes stop_codon:yes gene_type:complete
MSHLEYWQTQSDVEHFRKWNGNYNTDFKNHTRAYIKKKRHETVLDCGAGLFSEYYGFKKDEINIKYTATEITQKFIDIGISAGIDVHECSIQRMPFKDKSYDVVLCHAVLNHQMDFKDGIDEMVRVAKKQVIITFFKPFLEEPSAQKELNISKNRFFVEEKEGVGVVVHRVLNEQGAPSCIYNFFSLHAIKKFLQEREYEYFFDQSHNTRFLFINKKQNGN